MKLFYLDLETTGTNPGRHGVHQISGEIWIDGAQEERFDWHVRPNPKAQIEEEALKVAGVTRDQILAYPPMEEVRQELVGMLGRYVDRYDRKDKFMQVGYNNAAFDNDFFRGFFLQNGDQWYGSWFWSNVIDVMVLASVALAERRARMANFKLATVAKELGIEVTEAQLHGADYDIYLTRRIWEEIESQGLLARNCPN